MTTTSGQVPLDVYNTVRDQIDYLRGFANDFISQAETTLSSLDFLNVDPVTVSVDYNPETFFPGFDRPDAPADPSLPLVTPNLPGDPTIVAATMKDVGTAPTEPDFTNLTAYQQPSPPTDAAPTIPDFRIPALVDPTLPVPPDYMLPEAPTLITLGLPDAPTLVIPPFIGVRPTFDLDIPPDGQLAWAETPYVSPVRAQMLAALDTMFQGGSGLPVAVEQAIFDRGRAREDQASGKLVQEISDDMAARGLTEPNGILAQRLTEARALNRDKYAGLNRDLTIQVAQTALEGVKFAVANGMTLEQTLIQLNNQINERALKAALAMRDYMIARINAQIGYANLQVQSYRTDAEVWKIQIDGELGKLGLYRELIEARRLVGEINKDMVLRYEAQIRAVNGVAELYKANIEAAKAQAQINVEKIDAAKLVISAYSEQVSAWAKKFDVYRTQVDAALGTTRFYDVLAQVYATRMNGYKIKGDAYFEQGRFQIENNNQAVEVFKARLQRSEQDLRGQIATLDGQLKAFDSRVRLYEAKGNVAQAESAALDRVVGLKIEDERNRTAVAIEQARVRVDQAVKLAELLVEKLKTKAGVLAQLAAGTVAGMHVSAGISGSTAYDIGKHESFNYSGSTDDLNPNF